MCWEVSKIGRVGQRRRYTYWRSMALVLIIFGNRLRRKLGLAFQTLRAPLISATAHSLPNEPTNEQPKRAATSEAFLPDCPVNTPPPSRPPHPVSRRMNRLP